MRISTLQVFNNGVGGLQRAYSNAQRTQEQIASGNRMLTPADDPIASVRLLQLEEQQSMLTQHKGNLTAAQNSLVQEETVLNSVNNVLQSARDIAGKAGGGVLTAQDRKALASELSQYEEQLMGLMNSKDYRGDYMFSGYQGKTQPFVREADGTYAYQGDEGQRDLQIAGALSVAVSDNGKGIFENVTNAARMDSGITSVPGSTLQPSSSLVTDEVSFTSFPADGIAIRFDDPTDSKVYNIYDVNDPATVLASGRMDNKDDSADTLLFRGLSVQLDGVPASGDEVQITPPAVPREKQGILDTIANLRKVLESSSSSSVDVRSAVAEALTNIDNGIVSVDSARGSIGVRLNTIDTTLDDNENISIVNQSVQADLREVDYAEALSRLSMQTTMIEAAQKSYMKISSLSLFDVM